MYYYNKPINVQLHNLTRISSSSNTVSKFILTVFKVIQQKPQLRSERGTPI